MAEKPQKTGLDLLRDPFPAHHISKLPKPTKKQTEDLRTAMDRKDFSLGIRCTLCGQWHHKDVVHLDYVGHAALTDRLLDADIGWSWEPMSLGPDGLPALDRNGGMWIRLTICGVTRIGYGSADGKSGGDAIKEIIGDALRNAGMRFGAALDLWHKGDLHGDGDDGDEQPKSPPERQKPSTNSKADSRETYDRLSRTNRALATEADFNKFWAQANVQAAAKSMPADWQKTLKSEKEDKAAELSERAALASDDFPENPPHQERAA